MRKEHAVEWALIRRLIKNTHLTLFIFTFKDDFAYLGKLAA